MNQLVNRTPGMLMQQSKVFDDIPLTNEDLMEGVAVSFPVLGIKSGFWHYRWKGEDRIILDYEAKPDARGAYPPARFINVVLLKSQKALTRAYYASPYDDNSDTGRKPDCWSSDGIRPDDLVPQPVNPVCGSCPNAEWGSGASAVAPMAQACQQRRRVVLTPYTDDLTNEAAGGPMLLSLPPGSLRNLETYGAMLNKHGVHYAACVTQLTFDPTANGQRIMFTYVQPLTDDEATVSLSLAGSEARNIPADDKVMRILTSKIAVDGPEVEDTSAGVATDQGPPAVKPPPPPRQASSVQAPAAPAPQPARTAPQPAVRPAQTQPAQTQPAQPAKATTLRVGGHPAQAQPVQAQPVQAQPVHTTTINAAVAKPAQAPVSQRAVKTPPPAPPAAEQATVDDPPADETIEDELDKTFGAVMGNLPQ